MSRNTDLRQKTKAKLAAKMKRDGATSREISELIGIPIDKVAIRILLGERLLSIEEPEILQPPVDK